MITRIIWFAGLLASVAIAMPANAVELDRVDDFEDGTVQEWRPGGPSPNQSTNVADGGPNGAGDGFVQFASTGQPGAGGKSVIQNESQWLGDWVALDIVEVHMDVKVISGSAASIRVGFQDFIDTNAIRFVSTVAQNVPADNAWHHLTFNIRASEMSDVSVAQGSATLGQVMSAIEVFRILNSESTKWQGDEIAATLGFDNIRVVTGASTYQGWIWDSSVWNIPNALLQEEACFGQLDFFVREDDTWLAGGIDEVCWGRSTFFSVPARAFENFDGFNFFGNEDFDIQSTRSLVSAGGNLFELYGEDVFNGVGEGEGRLAMLLREPAGADLLLIGHYGLSDTASPQAGGGVFALAKSSADVRATRVEADVEGLWRFSFFTREPQQSDVNLEVTSSGISGFDLQSGGVCTAVESQVFQEPEFDNAGDFFFAAQFDINGVVLDDRGVQAGVFDRAISNCTWAIDVDDYLQVNFTSTTDAGAAALESRFVISDDENFLVSAPDPNGINRNPRGLQLGYRAPSALASNALDGNFLFYLNIGEYEATGTGSSYGNTGNQEFDAQGRGLIGFNSLVAGTIPAGQSGNWFSCNAELMLSFAEYRVGGNPSMGSFSTWLEVSTEEIVFSDCSYNLATDGALLVNFQIPDDEGGIDELLFAGYADTNGELLSLVHLGTEPDPYNPSAPEDFASIDHIVGMRYTGDPAADDDGDENTNLVEFQLPLPAPPPGPICSAAPLPVICGMSDVGGDGQPDVAAAIPGSVNVYVRDGVTDGDINDIDFGADPAFAVEMISDIDGNGAPEVAVLSQRPSGQVVVTVRDSLSDTIINTIFYGAAYVPLDMAVLPDSDGNGAPEFAVLGVDSSNGIRVQARDALTDAATSTTFYGNNATAIDVQVIPDINGNAAPEIAMHARVNASMQGRVQLRDSMTGVFIGQSFFGTVYTPLQIAVIDDVTGDGIPELAQLARRDDTGAVRIQVKDPAANVTVSNAFTGNTDTPVEIVGTGGMVGMLVEDAGGVAKVIKRDAFSGSFIGNVFMGAIGTPEALVVLDDLDGSGNPEFAALGDNAGQLVIQIKDTVSGAQINNLNVP